MEGSSAGSSGQAVSSASSTSTPRVTPSSDGGGWGGASWPQTASEPPFAIRPAREVPMRTLLEDFYQASIGQPTDAPPEPWPSRAGYSFRDVISTEAAPMGPETPPQANATMLVVFLAPLLLAPAPPPPASPPAVVLAIERAPLLPPPPPPPQPPLLVVRAMERVAVLLSAAEELPTHGEDPVAEGRRSRRRSRQGPSGLALMKASTSASTLQSDSPGSCPICLEAMLKKQRVRTFPCLHMLHVGCASRLLRAEGAVAKCPLCRAFVCSTEGRSSQG
mmetsp:Transcript_86244/g.272028  ORF Transcript_86244/g.272028 Transcript_86244/m.272028 type:complete len:277 (-) Transcript_86244:197-1027(-)